MRNNEEEGLRDAIDPGLAPLASSRLAVYAVITALTHHQLRSPLIWRGHFNFGFSGISEIIAGIRDEEAGMILWGGIRFKGCLAECLIYVILVCAGERFFIYMACVV